MKKRVFYMDFIRAVATMIIIIFHFNISVLGRQISNFSIFKNDSVFLNRLFNEVLATKRLRK